MTKQTKDSGEQRLRDPQYVAAESVFKIEMDAAGPSLYKAGKVGDTNNDTTNRCKGIHRIAQNMVNPKRRQSKANKEKLIESFDGIQS